MPASRTTASPGAHVPVAACKAAPPDRTAGLLRAPPVPPQLRPVRRMKELIYAITDWSSTFSGICGALEFSLHTKRN
jgi:hypothetical protein